MTFLLIVYYKFFKQKWQERNLGLMEEEFPTHLLQWITFKGEHYHLALCFFSRMHMLVRWFIIITYMYIYIYLLKFFFKFHVCIYI